MSTSCARAPSRARARRASNGFTCIGRYHPVRMICARPSASFWSVLFICILSAALACQASRQVTLSPRARDACTSHGVMGPVSTPVLASSPACPSPSARSAPVDLPRSICPGSVAHWPRHSRRPAPSTTQIAVSFCDTSKPTHRVIGPPPMLRTAGPQHPDRSIMDGLCPHRDDPMSKHAHRAAHHCAPLHLHAQAPGWITDEPRAKPTQNFMRSP